MRFRTDCLWFEPATKECIIRGKIFRCPRLCSFYNMVPANFVNFVKGIQRTTGLSGRELLKSEPVRNYLRRQRLVRV